MSSPKGIWKTRARKSLSNLHVGINILLMVALWLLVNYLALRNGFREDWSRSKPTVLAPRTEDILAELTQPVRVIAFMEEGYRAGDEVNDLLTELGLRTAAVQVERVDPDRDLGRVEEIKTRYGVREANQLVVVMGERSRVIAMDDMLLLEPEETRVPGVPPRLVGFQGESLVSRALLSLTRNKSPIVYFLRGHAEKDPDDFSNGQQAYSMVREKLEGDFLEVRQLNLEETREVPADADALVIAGPQTRIAQPELDRIRQYLGRPGRILMMLDADIETGLEPLLLEAGVSLRQDRVVEPSRSLIPETVHVTTYGEHVITGPLQGMRTIFVRPRSLEPLPGLEDQADRPRVHRLVDSSPRGWSEGTPSQNPPRYNPPLDIKGPVTLAAAIEIPGVEDGAGEMARLVVFGDSDFAGNWLNSGAGMLLVQQSANWLLDREDLIGIPAKPVQEVRLQMDQHGLNRLLLRVAVYLPLGLAFLGAFVSWRRRTS